MRTKRTSTTRDHAHFSARTGAQSLDGWRERPLAQTQRALDGDVFAPAHVDQQARDEQPDRQEQQRVKLALEGRHDRLPT